MPSHPTHQQQQPLIALLTLPTRDSISSMDHCGWGLMKTPWKLTQLKHFTREGQRLADPSNDAWATNYVGNHDLGRAVSRYGSDHLEFRVPSAKMLAVYLLSLSGTPVIYQGGE